MTKPEIIRFLEKYKAAAGFGTHKVVVEFKGPGEMPDCNWARVCADPHGDDLYLEISPEFMTQPARFQKEVLVHELIHGRVGLAQQQLKIAVESVENEIEEQMVRDITRLAMQKF